MNETDNKTDSRKPEQDIAVLAQELDAERKARFQVEQKLASLESQLSALERDATSEYGNIRDLQAEITRINDFVDEQDDALEEVKQGGDRAKARLDSLSGGDGSIRTEHNGDVIKLRQFHYMGCFDLYKTTPTTVQVRGDAKSFFMRGRATAVGAGTATIDTDITISANSYIYLKQDRDYLLAQDPPYSTAGVVTLEVGASVPDPDEATDYHPLWYIPWNGTGSQIVWNNIIDLRFHIFGMPFVDLASIEWEADNVLRLKDFPYAGLGTTPDTTNDFLVFQDADGGPAGRLKQIAYMTFASLASALGPITSVPIDNITGPLSSGGDTWLYDMAITLKHDELSDIVDVTCGDDHFKTNGGGDTIISYLRNSGDAARNYMEVGSGFGDTTGALSISPNLRSAYDTNGTTVTLDWDALVLTGEWGMAALNNFTIPSGNLAVTLGNVAVGTGNVTITAGELQITTGGVHVTSGGIATDLGDIETLSGAMAATGDIESSAGAVKAFTGFFVNGVGPFVAKYNSEVTEFDMVLAYTP